MLPFSDYTAPFNPAKPGAIGGTTAAAGTFTVLTCAQLVATVTSANTSAISSTGYSLTGTDATSLVNLAGTWNTSGTPTAIKLNITDTASNAASLLMDLQVGGASKFKVDKAGAINITSASSSAQIFAGSPYFAINPTFPIGLDRKSTRLNSSH